MKTKSIEERVDGLPKYNNGSKAIPRDEVVVPLSAVKNALQDQRQEIVEEITNLIINAGENSITKLTYGDENDDVCSNCLTGFTGTHWISQNDLIFQLTGKTREDFINTLNK